MIIAFSFLSLLKENYQQAIKEYNQFAKDNWLHFDVMDGKFVSNYTFDYKLIKEINEYNTLFSDVHLMIDTPLDVIDKYLETKPSQITFHYEAENEEKIRQTLSRVKSQGVKVGLSIKPDTLVTCLNSYLKDLDFILIMSVEPGKGGQKFLTNSLDKIRYLKERQKKYHYLIGVDGGINLDTAKMVKQAGADVIIVGTYLANNLNLETLNNLK